MISLLKNRISKFNLSIFHNLKKNTNYDKKFKNQPTFVIKPSNTHVKMHVTTHMSTSLLGHLDVGYTRTLVITTS